MLHSAEATALIRAFEILEQHALHADCSTVESRHEMRRKYLELRPLLTHIVGNLRESEA